MSAVEFQSPDYVAHSEGSDCKFGGFSCAYWIIAAGCTEPHWELHYVGPDGTCPCGYAFPGVFYCAVEFDANDDSPP